MTASSAGDDLSRSDTLTSVAADAPALVLTAIRKQFGEMVALDNASFTLRRGTVHALLGENGAGKTTLMRIAFGLVPPDSGTMDVEGTPRQFKTPRDAIHAGIGMVHQHFMLVPNMTVAENVALGGKGRYNAKRVAQRVREVGEQHGLAVDPDTEVRTLPIGAQQRVEILKALVRDARTLILDEPTAVLAPAEARALLTAMRDFVTRGGSVVLITHKLRDALEFADDVTVLRRGQIVYTSHASATNETALAAAMLGSSLATSQLTELQPAVAFQGVTSEERRTQRGTPVFVLQDVAVTDVREVTKLEHVSLTVHTGEIVGIAAVEGNGQHELLRVLANRQHAYTGRVEVPTVVGFVPEDRHRDAVVLDFSLYENIALTGSGIRRGTISWNRERATTEQVMREYDVRAAGASTTARTLSGGNQQKLVVGREMFAAPAALVVENPTRGLDVQAAAAVHARLRGAGAHGAAIVVYSSDLDEVLALADRIVVLYGGRLYDVPHDREAVGNAMVGRNLRASDDKGEHKPEHRLEPNAGHPVTRNKQ